MISNEFYMFLLPGKSEMYGNSVGFKPAARLGGGYGFTILLYMGIRLK